MIIECTNCHAKYQYDEDRFERKPSKKIKCAKCQAIFEIHNPAFAQKQKADETGRRHDATHIGKTKVPDTTEQSPMPEADARQTGKQPVEPRLPTGKRLSLAVLDGNDAGSVFRIEKPRVTIGRSGADVTLADSETSRQHAAIEVRETVYTLYDLESTNGTFVDGERIEEPYDLHDKSEFQIGTTTLMFIVTDEH
ncbi:MAG: zinc-ribbon domain-containing protein [Acidobacteria bacterium]|nr:zinc-ribbon domain-containing protein [Acidobacteriota bacterium]